MNRKHLLSVSVMVLSIVSIIFAQSYSFSPPTGVELSGKLAKAVDLYLDGEFDAGLKITDDLLAQSGLTANDTIAIYEVKSIITYAKGYKYKLESFEYLQEISGIGHCLINLPRELWPTELRDQWYKLCNEKNLLVCPDDSKPDVKTIAIMEFDNFSIGKYKEELGDLSKGLADFFEYDFSRFSDIKVVERDKLDYILQELKLVEEGKVDQASAVRVGKMLGAQLMVFGSITQLEKDSARMVVRVVDVETSEIISTADMEGKPNFVDMEKELVKKIAGQLDIMITDETKAAISESATEDMSAARLYSLGLKYMDNYEYKKAYEHFKMAYEKDNSFSEAKKKMEIYKPLIG
ncbi:MAG: hypothetical protein JW746_01490 [Candidatus Krumholzibacteriota bacterium]|nr:hypothetical protein [Candidatus Krumholzibacteriota bacterium]